MMVYRRAMHHCAVSDRAVIADGQGRVGINVQRAIILYISVSSDHDRSYIATHDRIVPDARAFVYSDIANNRGPWRDKRIIGDGGPDAVKRKYRHCFLLLASRPGKSRDTLSGAW